MARIELEDVSKVYGGNVRAVNDLTLDIPDGDFMVFVGPSGCGKSTALRMIAGLEDITEGEIRIGDRVVNDMPPKDRDIAMVFQNYALYPHMTVEDNLAFGLQLRRTPKDEQRRRVAEAARMLALEPFLKRKPAALSGGQRQRVAMGRAIVRNPQAYLMDEPLSNLDAKLRVSMRAQLASLHERLGVTTIYVTHDQIEAMTLGSRVAVLKDGELMQVDTPQALFDAPANLFVATFIGSPAMNLAEAKLVKDEGPALLVAGYRLPVPERAIREHPGLERFFDRRLIIGLRPSSLEDAVFAPEGWPQIKGEVAVTEELGSEVNLIFTMYAPQVHHEIMIARFDKAAKDEVEAGEGESLWTARVNPKTQARVGRTIDLAIDPNAFHFFDPESGEAIAFSSLEPRAGGEEFREPVIAAKPRRRKPTVRRHMNVSITRTVDGLPVPMTDNLELSTSYWLRVDIGALSGESAVVNAPEHSFPDRLLPRSADGHWLEVLAVSDDVRVDQTRHWLFLPSTGQSWVCPCPPNRAHGCSKADRRDHLYLPMTTRKRPMVATVRLSAYYRNNCLQSQLLTMNVGGAPEAVDGYGSFIDYSLTSDLESLENLPARSLNILTNETSSGAHRVIVTGSQRDSFPFSIGDLAVKSILKVIRRSLVEIHLRQEGEEWKTRYDSEYGKPAKEFERDLGRLARDGGQLYQEVFQSSEAQAELRSFLREEAQRLGEPAIIQVAQVSGSRIVLPWQLFYDIPVGNESEKYVPCRFLVDWMQGEMPADVPATCPYEHPPNTLCPFGFWGFAHIIEVPPSSLNHRLALYVTTDDPPVRLVVGLSDKLDSSLSTRHLASLVDCLGLARPDIARCSSMSTLESSLAGSDIDLIYFYCHGRRSRPEGADIGIPALEIGQSERITPMEVNTWKSGWSDEHWNRRRPLVVVNGCHTSELTPEEILSFVTAFSDAKAAGVVGTETSIEQGLAGTAMEWFLSSLKQGKKLGEAMHQMRWRLLHKRNVMGLTYAPYCSADLRLRRAA
jgi:multiple sugar transport system ATP-binding protein